MKFLKYIAVLCEGGSEAAIIDILLENNLLSFTKVDLIDEKIIRLRQAKKFEERYLRKSFNDKVTIIRILDSRNECFKISKAYKNKVDIINVITAPEIEMLIICSENKYNDYKHSNLKPSEYCKQILHMSNVKTYDFVKTYFSDISKLLDAIKEYHRVSNIKNNEYTLLDLLKRSSD